VNVEIFKNYFSQRNFSVVKKNDLKKKAILEMKSSKIN
jgi:hypothetical protein